VSLLDLPDDLLGLLAQRLYDGNAHAGLLATCRRTRDVGCAALTTAVIRWCAMCGTLDRNVVGSFPPAAVRPDGAHPAALSARLSSVRAFLRRAPHLRTLHLSDTGRCGGAYGGSPCDRFPAVREVTWRTVGDTLVGRPLARVTGPIPAVASVVRAARLPVLRELVLLFSALPTDGMSVVGPMLRAVGPTLQKLVLRNPDRTGNTWVSDDAFPWEVTPVQLTACFGGVALPALTLNIDRAHVDMPAAEALAAACPQLTELSMAARLDVGVGDVWRLERGRLPALRRLQLQVRDDRDHGIHTCGAEVRRFFAGRTLDTLCFGGFLLSAAEVSPWLTDAILGAAALPRCLAIHDMELDVADYEALWADPRWAARLEYVSPPDLPPGTAVFMTLGSLPRLTSLTLTLDTDAFDGAEPPGSPWDGLPGLVLLTVGVAGHSAHLFQPRDPSPAAEARLAAAADWFFATLVDPPCRPTLRSLRLVGRFVPDVAAFGRLRAYPALRALTTILPPIEWAPPPPAADGRTTRPLGAADRRRLTRELLALLPGVTTRVCWRDC